MRVRGLRCVIVLFIATTFVACGGSGGGGSGDISYTAKLIKADGQEVATTATPISLSTRIKITFAKAISASTDRTEIEDAIKLYAPDDVELDITFSWNEGYTQLTVTPAKRFGYQKQYTLTITAVTAQVSAIKSIAGGSFNFTTMTRGDFNGDSYADVLVGAYGVVVDGHAVGAAYVFNGSESGVEDTYATKLEGSVAAARFGFYWGSADVNGDGYDDAIVGEPYNDKGKAYVYLGSADGISTSPDTTLEGGTKNTRFGMMVDNAGDVNGDGFDDVIVGDVNYDTNFGAAYIYLGSANGLSDTPDTSILGAAGNLFGRCAAGAGDVNGDGFDDVMASAQATGKVYVYQGSSSGIPTTPSTTISGDIADWFGYFCSTAGDVNRDGYADIIVGAIVGKSAYVYLGSAEGVSTTPDTTLAEDVALYGFVAPAWDVNGDGYDDVMVGGPGAGGNKAFLYMGSATGISSTFAKRLKTDDEEGFGYVVPSRDVNADGYSDVIVGAPNYSGDKGASYIYLGSAAGLETAPSRITGEVVGDLFSKYIQ